MAKYSKAQWRPLAADETYQGLMTRHDGIVLHTAVGTLSGTDAYFMQGGYTGTESHFMVGPDGEIHQYTDTARRADANLDGNYRLLSIETADMGPPFPVWFGSNVPPWTEAQLDAIAGIVAWAAQTHDFPARLMESSRSTERGIGWHRQGIDGNFPAGLLSGRVSDGQRYSTSAGKVCPGDNRIRQIPSEVLPRVLAILAGPTTQAPSPTQGDDMPLSDVDLAKISAAFDARVDKLQARVNEIATNQLDREKVRAQVFRKGLADIRAAVDANAKPEQIKAMLNNLDATVNIVVRDDQVVSA